MRALSDAPANEFEPVRFVLTDMDATLTWQGRLSAAAYTSLEQLQSAGIRVIPVTAAPAGWCDQIARMWPVDGVIGENGGLFSAAPRTGMASSIITGTRTTPRHPSPPGCGPSPTGSWQRYRKPVWRTISPSA